MSNHLIAPHGGALVDLLAGGDAARALVQEAVTLPSLALTDRQQCDLELILTGAFSPLTGFLNRADYEGVVSNMRLTSGLLWPMPVCLDVAEDKAPAPGAKLALRDAEGMLLAILDVQAVWQPDRRAEARHVFGTEDETHPGVAHLLQRTKPVYVGGTLRGAGLPRHHDYRALRRTPAEVRALFAKNGWTKVVAFQTRNPMHRAHIELTRRAALEAGAHLLIHPVVGLTKPGDVDHYTRVRCYQAAQGRYPAGMAELSLLNLAMRMGGPREALWHAIIRKNFGCTHLIVGRDHAGPGNDSTGKPFYGPYDAQDLVQKHRDELGIEALPFKAMVYVEDRDAYMPADEVPEGARVKDISGTDLRRRLQEGLEIPEWFTYPEVAEVLRRSYPPRNRQGFTVFFTGLSGSGKSTLANGLLAVLLENGSRPVTLLDGDIVRTHLSSELGFSREHRDLNIRRIGFVASEITKNGGIAVCAPIAPYREARRDVRRMVSAVGGFVEVHVATPLEECEKRDTKGLYAKARQGLVKGFTGIDDPYEVPEKPELRIDTTNLAVEECLEQILLELEREGYLGARDA